VVEAGADGVRQDQPLTVKIIAFIVTTGHLPKKRGKKLTEKGRAKKGRRLIRELTEKTRRQ
jgi:hypothetical protein